MMSLAATVVRRRRAVLVVLAALTIGAGLLVHWAVAGPIGDVAGDALYAVLIYLLAAFAMPRSGALRPALIAVVFCTGIELLQLTGLPRDWAAVFPPSALVFGSGFDLRDLVVYACAVAAAATADAALTRAFRRTSP